MLATNYWWQIISRHKNSNKTGKRERESAFKNTVFGQMTIRSKTNKNAFNKKFQQAQASAAAYFRPINLAVQKRRKKVLLVRSGCVTLSVQLMFCFPRKYLPGEWDPKLNRSNKSDCVTKQTKITMDRMSDTNNLFKALKVWERKAIDISVAHICKRLSSSGVSNLLEAQRTRLLFHDVFEEYFDLHYWSVSFSLMR